MFNTRKKMVKRRRSQAREATSSRVEDSKEERFPLRDVNGLYCSTETSFCALKNLCVPCAYKICNFDVALDNHFCQSAPNQRPELCPRIRSPPLKPVVGTLGYQMGMRVLTCGDGDFTFSLALARMLLGNEGTSAASKLTATSYETSETLEKVYPNFVDTLTELKQLGCLLQFGFDATRLKESLGITNGDVKFDRIVWNFPCLAVAKGQDGQNGEMDENKALVSKFIVPARDLLTDGGEIHICHKTKPPFNQWRLEEVVTGTCDDVHFQGKVVFDRATTPPYTPRKALDRKSFPCHDACTFIFRLRSRPKGRFHPTLYLGNELMEAVTHELISEIRSAHLVKAQYSSYIEEETKKRSGKKSRKQN